MHNTIFVMNGGCSYCHELKKAVLIANSNLTTEKKIYLQDIHLGDSGIAFMENRYPEGRYPLPLTILDRFANRKGTLEINRAVLMSSSLKELDAELIKEILA